MSLIELLSKNFPNQDLHVVNAVDEHDYHIGYYFWNATDKHHYLQTICAMRTEIGLEVADVRELLQAAKLVRVSVKDGLAGLQ